MNPALNQAPVQPHVIEQTSGEDLLNQIIDVEMDEWGKRELQSIKIAEKIGEMAASSAYFKEAETITQNAIRIMIGRDLNISATTALREVKFIKGNVTLSANLIATLLRRAGYTWTFVKHDAEACVMKFYRHGQPLPEDAGGKMEFTIEDARKALLTDRAPKAGKESSDSMYEKYPRNMMYSRNITNFQKWHAPEVSNGLTIYTPDEVEGITERLPDASGFKQPQRKVEEPVNV